MVQIRSRAIRFHIKAWIPGSLSQLLLRERIELLCQVTESSVGCVAKVTALVGALVASQHLTRFIKATQIKCAAPYDGSASKWYVICDDCVKMRHGWY